MSHAEVKEIADKIDSRHRRPTRNKLEIHRNCRGRAGFGWYSIAHYGSNNMITLRYRLKVSRCKPSSKSFKDGNTEFPAGSFIVPANQSGKNVKR